MSIEVMKQVVRAYADAFSRGDFEAVRAICTPDVTFQGVLGKGGLEVAMPIWNDLHAAFAPQLKVDDMVAEGDRLAVRLTETGTFRAPFRGMQPTGKTYSLIAMEWFRFEGDKIAERWGARDFASLMRQVGAAS